MRTQNKGGRTRGTHTLEMIDDRGRNKSGHRKKATEHRALTDWRQQREGLVKTGKESDRARALTDYRRQRGGQVRT